MSASATVQASMRISLAIPMRHSPSFARILSAVAPGSSGTMSRPRMNASPKAPPRMMSR